MMAQTLGRGTISWLDEKGDSGIILTPDPNPSTVYFKRDQVIIGTPDLGKTAQFTLETDNTLGLIATNIIIVEDMARGARFQSLE